MSRAAFLPGTARRDPFKTMIQCFPPLAEKGRYEYDLSKMQKEPRFFLL